MSNWFGPKANSMFLSKNPEPAVRLTLKMFVVAITMVDGILLERAVMGYDEADALHRALDPVAWNLGGVWYPRHSAVKLTVRDA